MPSRLRGRLVALAAAMLALLPAAARAELIVGIGPAASSDVPYEEERLNLSSSGTDGARLVLKFGPAEAPCAAEPGTDARATVADTTVVDFGVNATAVAPEPGLYRACAWELDGGGGVRDRGEAAAEVVQQFAEASVAVGAPRVYRGIPNAVRSSGVGRKGRVLQTAVVTGACPASAPAADDPAVRDWLGGAGGVVVTMEGREYAFRQKLVTVGTYAVCSWVGERPGDPAPEATSQASMTIVAGKAKPTLMVSATRDGGYVAKPVWWSATLFGVFDGPLYVEARKAVHGSSARVVGSGPWQRVATLDLARQRVRPGADNGLMGFGFVRARGKVRLPASIGRQCGNQARIAFLRLRFPGSTVARPAASKPVELVGSLGGC